MGRDEAIMPTKKASNSNQEIEASVPATAPAQEPAPAPTPAATPAPVPVTTPAPRRSSSASSSRSSSSGTRRTSSSRRRQEIRPAGWRLQMTTDQKLDWLGGGMLLVAVLTILSMVSEPGDLTGPWIEFLKQGFGWGMYVVPLFIGAIGFWLVLRRFGDRIPWPEKKQVAGIAFGFFIALITLHLVATWIYPKASLLDLALRGLGGGYLGANLLLVGQQTIGSAGVIVVLIPAWFLVITFTAGLTPVEAIEMLMSGRQRDPSDMLPDFDDPPIYTGGARPVNVVPARQPLLLGSEEPEKPAEKPVEKPVEKAAPVEAAGSNRKGKPGKPGDEPQINAAARPNAASAINAGNGLGNGNGNGEMKISPTPVGTQAWRLPRVADLLEQGSEQDFSQDLLRKQSRIIEETLASLGAPVKVKEINRGPTVTQFGVEPLFVTTRGDKTTKVKVSKIVGLADDLALALSAQRIRIEAPVPGKGLVGIEVPNVEPAVVALRDVMESENFEHLKGSLRLALGQDVSGQAVSADLRSMPHMLIAGTTGSGKSVCINAIIAALLLQNSPDTLRMLMVDPKRVELTQYGGIPHLLAPVIVDVDRVVPALRWVMREMDSRYRRFAEVGARNVEDFNRRAAKEGDALYPYIVVMVDELADMMMQAPEETERVICRLAQMARATGIHLIIATQRPSVDVVTGLIKANFPARIAFAVASSIDSRVILDTPGAERLLGRGDMLFMPPDAGQPLRMQGTFVSDDELNRLIAHWRDSIEPGSLETKMVLPTPAGESSKGVQPALFPELVDETPVGQNFEDSLLPTAVEVLLAENRASVSLLQRRMRIGYTRAARLIDLLSDMGIVTPTAEEGQFRGVNRTVAESFLRSLRSEGKAQE